MLPIISVIISVLLVALYLWQKKIDGEKNKKVRESLNQATQQGSHQPIAQHPIIDSLSCIGCSTCIKACPEEEVIELIQRVAQIVHGARCIGHALCAEACPVGAIQVGLGDIKGRADLPILSDKGESSVPGLFIAGELGGIALVRNAIEQGKTAAQEIIRRIHSKPSHQGKDELFDLVTIGAGPTGLAVSLCAKEAGLNYRTIDQQQLGGTVRKYPRQKLTMTQPVDLPLYGRMTQNEYLKEELIDLWEGICSEFQLEIHHGINLQSVTTHKDFFIVHTDQGDLRSRFVILALGRRGTPRKLNVPGEEQEKVLYQLIDAASYQHKKLLIVGGGDSAIEAATGLANQLGNQVTLSYRKEHFFRLKDRNRKRLEEYQRAGKLRVILSSQVKEIGVRTVSIEQAQQIEYLANDFVFVFAGGIAPFALLKEAGILFGDSLNSKSSKVDKVHAS